jgi:alkylation response protein AidB-like acyl-CoA dehydrogenase
MVTGPAAQGSFAELRREIRILAEQQIAPHVAQAETERELLEPIREALGHAGCFGRTLPVAYGGRDAGLGAFAAQQEELSRVWPTAAVGATWTNLSGLLLRRFGSDLQKKELLPHLADGSMLGAIAWTEPQGGSDAAALHTIAIKVDGGWRLDGAKRLIDNAKNADFIIVGARTSQNENPHKSLSMFVLHREDPGFVFGGAYDTLGLRAAGVGWFTLRDCFVPEGRLLGEVGHGFYQMMAMVELGRVGVAAMCLGIAEACLTAAVEFLTTRSAGGRPLAGNDVVLASVADMRVRIDAARLLTERAAALADGGQRCGREAAMAKLYASEVACDVSARALHLHGGIGYTSEVGVERLFRDSQAFTIGEGTSEVLRLIVGRAEFAGR